MKQPAKDPVFRNAYPCRSCIRCRCCPCICPPGGAAPPLGDPKKPSSGEVHVTILLVAARGHTLLYKGRVVRPGRRRVKARIKGARPPAQE